MTDLIPSLGDLVAVATWAIVGGLVVHEHHRERRRRRRRTLLIGELGPELIELPPGYRIIPRGPFDWRQDPEL